MAEEQAQNEDFGAYLNAQAETFKNDFQSGEQIKGKVVAVDREMVFVDINARTEGILPREEVVDEDGNVTVQAGDTIDVYFLGGDDRELRLTTRLSGEIAQESLMNAYRSGIPVEGRVESERNGGFEVKVSGQRGFCPYSQMDVSRGEPDKYIGERFNFVIIECGNQGKNLVLSRRKLQEKERENRRKELKKELTEGDVVEGSVTKVADFGAFVNLGGVDGLIPIRELAWGHTENTEDVVKEGEKVQVVVQKLDWENERISLSLRLTQGNPWDKVEENYPRGTKVTGKITKLMPFGAFVELEPGVEGLVHISKLGAGRPINHPEEVVEEGQSVEVTVENVDLEKQRVGLTMDDSTQIEEDVEAPEEAAVEIKEGNQITGTVDGVKDFGVFVKLDRQTTGLLHISQIDELPEKNREQALREKFQEGNNVTVSIKQIQGDRVSLTLPHKANETSEEKGATPTSEYIQNSTGEGLGTLGDTLDQLNL